jgi:hypothetical protein
MAESSLSGRSSLFIRTASNETRATSTRLMHSYPNDGSARAHLQENTMRPHSFPFRTGRRSAPVRIWRGWRCAWCSAGFCGISVSPEFPVLCMTNGKRRSRIGLWCIMNLCWSTSRVGNESSMKIGVHVIIIAVFYFHRVFCLLNWAPTS